MVVRVRRASGQGGFGMPSLFLMLAVLSPWLDRMDPGHHAREGVVVRSAASVAVSDGLKYTIATEFRDWQHASLTRVYPDRTVIQSVDGQQAWESDGTTRKEASPSIAGFVVGHQVHALLLNFGETQLEDAPATMDGEFDGRPCHYQVGMIWNVPWTLYFDDSGLPLALVRGLDQGSIVTFRFDDWRVVKGVSLPFVVNLDDGLRTFRYSYTSIELLPP